jgi:hypothetical protein
MKRIPLALLVVASVTLAIVLVSCQHTSSPTAQTPINTMWSSTTVPTTQTAKLLGFNFPPAPAGTGRADEAEVAAFSKSCLACHSQTDSHTMHETAVRLACVDCHGGHPDIDVPANISSTDPKYRTLMLAAHVEPRNRELWSSSANPQVAATATITESPDFVRFVNPGDLRAAQVACASCHAEETRNVPKSMMSHGAMLWEAALYNNGSNASKTAIFGEGYAPDGSPAVVRPVHPPTTRQAEQNGMLVGLWPILRWEISQPGNILRVFERGGISRPVIGVPNSLEPPGRPEVKLSLRGLGTEVRTDPVNIGLQKTRLMDPTLTFMGTNDHPGDYRASGCSACHVVYANDRSPVHSARWAQFGNQGKSFSKDPTVNPDHNQPAATGAAASAAGGFPAKLSTEGKLSVGTAQVSQINTTSGHPIEHKFVRSMPTSTCIVCHVHPGTNVLNSYLGFMWWDNESDAQFMYPKKQKNPTPDDEFKASLHNPEGSAARGLWGDEGFLENLGTPEFNSKLQRMHFADFHGHGWVFRAVFKQDRHGHFLDHRGEIVKDVNAANMAEAVDYASPPLDRNQTMKPQADNVPVHLKDIHLEKGMQCVDCHFAQDAHGDGNLYGETRNPVMVECQDCHGDVDKEAKILTYLKDTRASNADDLVIGAFTGNSAPKNPTADQIAQRKTFLKNRFEEDGGKLWQKSALDPQKGWYVSQTAKLNPNGTASEKAGAYAHTIRRDNKTWGTPPAMDEKNEDLKLAHSSTNMSCYACHSSWNTSCFGCHLPQRANQRKPMLHNEGSITRNYTNYNYQTLRDDVYMLGIDSSVKGHKVVPIRSACAVMVSSQDALRQSLYTQQQTMSAEGFAGTSFSPYFPHTVRATETKQCNDCHISKDKEGHVDNNAIMAQLLLQGTNSVNFLGKWAWVAEGNGGLEAVAVTEATEPQAVIGSTLHKWAYPDDYAAHQKRGKELVEEHHHDGSVLDLQARGEYLYAACGKDGFIAYDIANIDNKGFSERIITAPVSPLGQRFYVRSKYATSICSPSTLAIDPTRPHYPENQEQSVHLMYAFLYMTDAQEGLIVIGNPLDDKKNKPGVATLLDGDPDNNFLQRALTFNPGGLLKGARHMALHGHHAFISCDAGIVVLDLDNPLKPRVVTTLKGYSQPRKVAFQFRYGFVLDNSGLHVLDVTDVENPKPVSGADLQLADARDIYISRTYAYIAGGKDGLHIVDVERPEAPKLLQTFNADGRLNDTTAVRIGMTNSSMYAYVADGRNGFDVLQLTSPDDDPTYGGFSPKLEPRLIAHHKTRGPALAISEGLDRDRAVDEAGDQLAVFGRKGARPFTLAEMQRFYLKNGQIYTVSNTATGEPLKSAVTEPPKTETPTPPRRGIPRRK